MNVFEKWFFKLRTGYPIEEDNYIEDGWIRYKDIYISILKGDHGYSVSWQDYPPAHFPVREILIAAPASQESSGVKNKPGGLLNSSTTKLQIMSDSKELNSTVCVVCDNHLAELLKTLPKDHVALLGYVDDKGDIQALNEAKIEQIIDRRVREVIDELTDAYNDMVINSDSSFKQFRDRLAQLTQAEDKADG